jgi:phosphoglucosamine mutase
MHDPAVRAPTWPTLPDDRDQTKCEVENVKERRLFGTDGVRGRANETPMTPDVALKIGRAITHVARHGGATTPRIIIGKDTRLSGYMLETALASGICAMGGFVMLSGPIPTPAVANLTQSMRADAGVVISASHNPFDDNGIKIFGPDGFKLPDAEEAAIEALLEDPSLLGTGFVGNRVGRAERIEDATGRYIVHAKSTFPKQLTLKGLKLVVDAAHGAGYRVAPHVFAELGADVVTLGSEPNGLNINDGCGALHPEHVVQAVRQNGAQLGIALDGDADRVIMVDEAGRQVDGDTVMAICATRMMQRGRLPKNTVVATVMSNMGLEKTLATFGGRLVRTVVGDRYVVEEMRRSGYGFGGEQSGHLIFLEHTTTGDGVVAALQVLAVMVSEGRALSELARVMQHMPQVLKNVGLPVRRPLSEMLELSRVMADVEKTLDTDGRLLVRWSGTEPKLRIMVEGPNLEDLERYSEDMVVAARRDFGLGV